MFITVEGIEGSGKSTLLAGLVLRMREAGVNVITTREPGGTMLGNRLRSLFVDPASGAIDPLTEALMLNASRAQLIAEVIGPALQQAGRWVLCDRYTHATLAYQGYGRGLSLNVLRALSALAAKGIAPELTFLVDIPVDISRKRVMSRASATGVSADRLEREDLDFHTRVREGYLALAREDERIKILNGMLETEALLDTAWAFIRPHIAVKPS
jgi:dTMP kinase